MDPDKYQQAWQAQSSQTRVTVDANLLLQEVQRSQRNFRAAIFRRDFLEVGIALLLLPVWIYLGVTMASPWTWYLTVPVLVWLVGFMLVYRLRHPQKPNEPDEPLLQCVKNSLTQVEDQICLLRNIFWWYLLPPTISILAFFAHITWLNSEDWLDALGHAGVFVFLLALYSFIYYLNQRAVRVQLEPRRQELLTLLASLGDETTSGESAVMKNAEGVKPSGIFRHPISVLFLLVTLAVLGSAVAVFVSPAQYPKRAPFTGVRWEGEKPLVEIGDEWFRLVSIDDLPAAEIVAFSQRTYSSKWLKRFEEDLVELLSRMGHPPQDTVKLVVRSLTTSQTHVLEDIPMTKMNRKAIKAAAQARATTER